MNKNKESEYYQISFNIDRGDGSKLATLIAQRDALLAFKKHATATIGQYDKAHMKCKARHDELLAQVKVKDNALTRLRAAYCRMESKLSMEQRAEVAIANAKAEKGGDMMSDGSPVKDTWEERNPYE